MLHTKALSHEVYFNGVTLLREHNVINIPKSIVCRLSSLAGSLLSVVLLNVHGCSLCQFRFAICDLRAYVHVRVVYFNYNTTHHRMFYHFFFFFSFSPFAFKIWILNNMFAVRTHTVGTSHMCGMAIPKHANESYYIYECVKSFFFLLRLVGPRFGNIFYALKGIYETRSHKLTISKNNKRTKTIT